MNFLLMNFFLFILIKKSECNIWCYNCINSQPGCSESYVDWRIQKTQTCPEKNDKCVKIIERRENEVQVIRNCLSNLIGQRFDIPADKYEGCRPAAKPKVSIYVHNKIPELDLKRDYYPNVEYCFCEFDQWCNNAKIIGAHLSIIILCFILLQIFTKIIS